MYKGKIVSRDVLKGETMFGVSEKHNFVFFRVPKAAMTSISDIFLKRREKRLMDYYQNKKIYDPDLYTSHYKFTFVRNPFDRLVSAWINKAKPGTRYTPFVPISGLSFEDFIKVIATQDMFEIDQHVRLQSALVPCDVKFIGKVETIQEDIKEVWERIGLPSMKRLQHINSSIHEHYSKYYNKELIKIVSSLYKRDFERFNYSTNIEVLN